MCWKDYGFCFSCSSQGVMFGAHFEYFAMGIVVSKYISKYFERKCNPETVAQVTWVNPIAVGKLLSKLIDMAWLKQLATWWTRSSQVMLDFLKHVKGRGGVLKTSESAKIKTITMKWLQIDQAWITSTLSLQIMYYYMILGDIRTLTWWDNV